MRFPAGVDGTGGGFTGSSRPG